MSVHEVKVPRHWDPPIIFTDQDYERMQPHKDNHMVIIIITTNFKIERSTRSKVEEMHRDSYGVLKGSSRYAKGRHHLNRPENDPTLLLGKPEGLERRQGCIHIEGYGHGKYRSKFFKSQKLSLNLSTKSVDKKKMRLREEKQGTIREETNKM
ncbi:hypothetical protein CR513_19539, partial [Mucuna pruriens]